MVDYNDFAKKFAQSRKNMRWEELEYFFSCFSGNEKIADIGCGSGRFLEQYRAYFQKLPENYTGLDLSGELLQEAKKQFPKQQFICKNMLEIGEVFRNEKIDTLIIIASFHHLANLKERENFLESAYKILPKGGKIYMTNWNLLGEENSQKYHHCLIPESRNSFGSRDFNIKFGDSDRFYHAFSLEELEFLSHKVGFKIIENRVFDSQKNILTVLEK